MTISLTASEVIDVLRRHANHPSAFLATNQETKHFSAPDVEGIIAYRCAGRRHVVMVSGVIAAPEQRAVLLDRFLAWAKKEGRKVIAVQVMREDAELLGKRGFRVNQIGASYSVSLENFRLAGTRFLKLRNKIAKAKRSEIEVLEIGAGLEPSEEIQQEIASIDASWLQSKGSHVKELTFLVGEVGPLQSLDRSVKRLFTARMQGKIIGYILYTASFGAYRGWMHDLSRRLQDAPPGVMELINATAIECFRKENAAMLNFGFTPLTSLEPRFDLAPYSSPIARWVFQKLAKYGSFIYPAATQLQYKLKWAPNIIEPEYIAFQDKFTLVGLWHFLRLTRAI